MLNQNFGRDINSYAPEVIHDLSRAVGTRDGALRPIHAYLIQQLPDTLICWLVVDQLLIRYEALAGVRQTLTITIPVRRIRRIAAEVLTVDEGEEHHTIIEVDADASTTVDDFINGGEVKRTYPTTYSIRAIAGQDVENLYRFTDTLRAHMQ